MREQSSEHAFSRFGMFRPPSHVVKQWELSSRNASRKVSMESLEMKLEEAALRRQALQRNMDHRRRRNALYPDAYRQVKDSHVYNYEALQKLQRRLARAESNRSQILESIRLRAIHRERVRNKVNAMMVKRSRELQARMEQNLKAAAEARRLQLTKIAEKAARHVSRVRMVAESVKSSSKMNAMKKKNRIDDKIVQAQRKRNAQLISRRGESTSGVTDDFKDSQLDRESEQAVAHMNSTEDDRLCSLNTRETFLIPEDCRNRNAVGDAAAKVIQNTWRKYSLGKQSQVENSIRSCVDDFLKCGIIFNDALFDSEAEFNDKRAVNLANGSMNPASRHEVDVYSSLNRNLAEATKIAAVTDRNEVPITPSPSRSPSRITLSGGRNLSFDEFAAKISCADTIRITGKLLKCIEAMAVRLNCLSPYCDELLQKLFPRRKAALKPSTKQVKSQKCIASGSSKTGVKKVSNLSDRYPARPLLSAYMALAHPEVVLNGHGHAEESLTIASSHMIRQFEMLLSALSSESINCSKMEDHFHCRNSQVRTMVEKFDRSWVAYLEAFLTWKDADAAGLEAELIRAAVELESSRLEKMLSISRSGRIRHACDVQALAEGVDNDLRLLSDRINRLTGKGGKARLEAALNAVRASFQFGVEHSNSSECKSNNQGKDLELKNCAAMCVRNDKEYSERGEANLTRSPSKSPMKKASRTKGAYRENQNPLSDSISCQRTDMDNGRQLFSPFDSPNVDELMTDNRQPSVKHEIDAEDQITSSPRTPRLGPDQDSEGSSAMHQPEKREIGKDSVKLDYNVSLLWRLLYNPEWRLPTTELDVLWQDAFEMNEVQPGTLSDALGLTEANIEEATKLQIQIRRIAEKAFWDNFQERLIRGDTNEKESGKRSGIGFESSESNKTCDTSQVVSLLTELGKSILDVLPENSQKHREDVIHHLGSEEKIVQQLANSDGVSPFNTKYLFELLQWVTELIRKLGAPVRETNSQNAAHLIHSKLTQIMRTEPLENERDRLQYLTDMASVVAQALRFIVLQLSFLRIDLANAHLNILLNNIANDNIVEYIQQALSDSELLGTLPETYFTILDKKTNECLLNPSLDSKLQGKISVNLPHTHGWMALSSGIIPQIEQLMESSSTGLRTECCNESFGRAQTDQHPNHKIPVSLKTGRYRRSDTMPSNTNNRLHSPSSHGSLTEIDSLEGLAQATPSSWQGIVRIGIVHLLTGEGAITKLSIPETLKYDSNKLFDLQNEFQKVIILTASILCIRQLKHGVSESSSMGGLETDGNTNEPLSEYRLSLLLKRLNTILGSTNISIEHISAEVARVFTSDNETDPTSVQTTAQRLLKAMTNRGSPTLRVVKSGVTNALVALTISGCNKRNGELIAQRCLMSCGARPLWGQVKQLACQVAEIIKVSEKVCGPWYYALYQELP